MPTEWQPFELAPKDGRRFLAARKCEGPNHVGQWIVRVCSYAYSRRRDAVVLKGWDLGSATVVEPTPCASFDMPT